MEEVKDIKHEARLELESVWQPFPSLPYCLGSQRAQLELRLRSHPLSVSRNLFAQLSHLKAAS